MTTLDHTEGPPSSCLQLKTKQLKTSKIQDPLKRNPAPVDPPNAILEVNQVQTASRAGFGWQAVLLLTIIANLLITLFLCFRL